MSKLSHALLQIIKNKPLKLKEWMSDDKQPMTFAEWLKEETRLSSMAKKPEVKSTEDEWKDISK